MKKNNIKVYIVLVAIIIGIGIYVYFNNRINTAYTPDYNLEDFYVTPNRKTEVNEYKVVYMNNEDIVRLYFNNYITMMIENTSKAYQLLDEDYRELKYPSIELYNQYIEKITKQYTVLPKMESYEINTINNKIIYKVEDQNDNKYIFSVEAVMKYTVYLDENTIKIE